MDFTNYNDMVVGHTTVIVGIHNSTESLVEKFQFKTPPSTLPLHLTSLLWQNFNKVEYGISYGCENDDFEKEPYTGFTTSLPFPTISTSIPDGVKPLYFLHADGSDTSILAGTTVIFWDSLCPLFTSAPNCNIFQSHFGVKFFVDGKQYVPQFSPFEYTSCYPFQDSLRYQLSHQDSWYALDAGILAMTSLCILILSMIAFAKSVTQSLRFSNPINLQHLQHISKLLSMGLLAQGCPTIPNGFTP
jgi:hypothetical protein